MDYIICKEIKELEESIKKLVFSQRQADDFPYSKITVKPYQGKKGLMWQMEKIKGAQAFHENLSTAELISWIEAEGKTKFGQCCLTAQGTTIHYTIFPDKTKRKQTENSLKREKPLSHNKEKNYILQQGTNIPAFVDLGVFTKDFKIVNSKYDKFKQINRFIEIVDDAFKSYPKDEITILDFG